MERMGHVIHLKESAKAEYLKMHAEVWPSVLEIIATANIRNYSIFLREPENLLFAYWEYVGTDFAADIERLSAEPEMQRWWQLTDRMQSSLTSSGAAEHWAPMSHVFYTNERQKDKEG